MGKGRAAGPVQWIRNACRTSVLLRGTMKIVKAKTGTPILFLLPLSIAYLLIVTPLFIMDFPKPFAYIVYIFGAIFILLMIYLIYELYVFFIIRNFGISLQINYIRSDKNTLELNICIKQDKERKRIDIKNIQCFYVRSMPGGVLKIPLDIKYEQPAAPNKNFNLFVEIQGNQNYMNQDCYLSATLKIKRRMKVKIYFPGFIGEEPIFYKIFPC